MQCIAFDSRKHCAWALVQDEAGKMTFTPKPVHFQS